MRRWQGPKSGLQMTDVWEKPCYFITTYAYTRQDLLPFATEEIRQRGRSALGHSDNRTMMLWF